MAFSSVPPFLDHHNWHHQLQQSNPHQGSGSGVENPNFQPLVPHPRSGVGSDGGGGGERSTRHGSMMDQARLAKLPLPQPGLKCPRCDSSNTKFCYFNNHRFTQPRYFCKTCKRHWTQGGTLRNLPFTGSSRRNKRSNKRQTRPKSESGSPAMCITENIATSTQLAHPPSLQLPFMSSYGGVGGNIASYLGEFHLQDEMGSSNGNNFSNLLSIAGGESWRLPFLARFEVPSNTNLFPYQSEGAVEASSSSIIENSQEDPMVKVQENGGLNLSRQILGFSENTNEQPWPVGNKWADFSGANTFFTPTTHFI